MCFLFSSANIFCNIFQYETVDSGMLSNENKITLFDDTQKIGFVSYTKIPCSSFFVIHSLYVYPQHRNQGFGRKLLLHACDTLHDLDAYKIYIQPGPFEIIHGRGKNIVGLDRQERIKKLCHLYQKCGFAPADFLTKRFAGLLYLMIKIDENSDHLRVKNFY